MPVQAVQNIDFQAPASADTDLGALAQQMLDCKDDASHLLFQLLVELVDRRLAVLVERAKAVIGEYWTERDTVTHERPRSEWSRLGVRAGSTGVISASSGSSKTGAGSRVQQVGGLRFPSISPRDGEPGTRRRCSSPMPRIGSCL